ncbi:hypothetical protein GCM10018987_53610 [Streptomyces cremeus]
MAKRALITGVTGQDGSYLAEHLLSLGYRVWGLTRGQANPRKDRVSRLVPDLEFVHGDLMDQGSLVTAVNAVQPDEVYNLGAISFVPMSWQQPELVTEVNGTGVLRMLEAIRIVSGLTKPSANGVVDGQIRFYQASSSEMFGMVTQSPQSETTSFHPRSPYGVVKTYGHYMTRNYRESYGMYAASGILFNHESPRRGAEFVTRKISLAVAQIKLGLQEKLSLGNLDAVRDWGFAGGLRPRHAPHAPAGSAGRLRGRYGADVLGARRGQDRLRMRGSELGGLRVRGPRPRASRRGGDPVRRLLPRP